jgi:hypothetical protein
MGLRNRMTNRPPATRHLRWQYPQVTTTSPPTSPFKKPIVIVGLLIGVVFLIRDVGLGVHGGYQRGRELRRRVDANLAAFRKASASLKQIKESMTATRLSGDQTVEQFAANCRAIRPALAQWRQSLDDVHRILAELERDARAARDPGWKTLGPVFQKAAALDAEHLPLVEQQVALAEPLETMAPAARKAYFDQKIRPLLDAEVAIEAKKDVTQQELQEALASLKGQ